MLQDDWAGEVGLGSTPPPTHTHILQVYRLGFSAAGLGEG